MVLLQNLVLAIGFCIVYYALDKLLQGAFNVSICHTPTDVLYFTIVTQTTVGYGDIHPKHTIAKIFVLLHVVVSLYVNIIRPLHYADERK